jgi:hypothetical protein
VQERLLENWLTNINERSFEIPFSQLLASENFSVIHLSRHGPFEDGKDLLAIDPDGNPCAFQIKGAEGGKITQKAWASFIPQITRLVELPIKHPSINPDLPRRTFFVTTGELDEEVRTEIETRNIDWNNRKLPKLEVIVKGELLQRFKSLQSNFWPENLSYERDLLGFYLADGASNINKKGFSRFVSSLLPLNGENPGNQICKRSLASAGIFTAYALMPFEQQQNHASIVEKHLLEEKYWRGSFEIASHAIENSLENLWGELKNRKHFTEGNPLVDGLFYRGRMTKLLGLASAYGIIKSHQDTNWKSEEVYKFISEHQKEVILWGEAAAPQILALYWFLKINSLSYNSDYLLFDMIGAICQVNEQANGIPDPYHDFGEIMETLLKLSETSTPEIYKGRSYILESLIQLFARREWRGALADMWNLITHIDFAEFIPPNPSDFCFWYLEDGLFKLTKPEMPQSWKKLQEQAKKTDTSNIPNLLKENPGLLLLFSIVFPHRLNKNVVKFLDDKFFYNKP